MLRLSIVVTCVLLHRFYPCLTRGLPFHILQFFPQTSYLGEMELNVMCSRKGDAMNMIRAGTDSKYKRTVWQCNAKFKEESKCATPHLYEQQMKEMFLETLGILMENREGIIGDCRADPEAGR